MSLTAAEIGEKVAVGQTAMVAVEPILGARLDEQNGPDLITGVLHYLVANGYDAMSLANEALDQFEADRRGPVL